ncbi:hypothetical protein ACSBR2_015905 [Camellia fascicularis]
MSPEYAMGGLFSEKSDVYSFGVLLLEVVNGVRNTSFHYHEKYLNLLGYDHVADRPTISIVVLIMSNEMDLPHPKQPTFTIQSLSDADLRSQRFCYMFIQNQIICKDSWISAVEGHKILSSKPIRCTINMVADAIDHSSKS